MTARNVSIVEDPDLGPVRYCRRCDEWWPDDVEFYRVVRPSRSGSVKQCRACLRYWNRISYERLREREPERLRAYWRESARRYRSRAA